MTAPTDFTLRPAAHRAESTDSLSPAPSSEASDADSDSTYEDADVREALQAMSSWLSGVCQLTGHLKGECLLGLQTSGWNGPALKWKALDEESGGREEERSSAREWVLLGEQARIGRSIDALEGTWNTILEQPAGTAFLNSAQKDEHNKCIEDMLDARLQVQQATLMSLKQLRDGGRSGERSLNQSSRFGRDEMECEHELLEELRARMNSQECSSLITLLDGRVTIEAGPGTKVDEEVECLLRRSSRTAGPARRTHQ